MTNNEEVELSCILKENPFLGEIAKWKEDLSCFVEGRKRLEELNFILESDTGNFSRYQSQTAKRKKDWDTYLHPEVLPQPFIGDPHAPIWYLLLNPGYSFPDRYDHLGICPCCKRKLFTSNTSEYDCIFDRGRNRLDVMKKRQQLLLRQLQLEAGTPFYLLDDSFNALPDEKKYKKEGGYRWWRSVLFGANKKSSDFLLPACGVDVNAYTVGKKLFVLECCPYHSPNFDKKVLWRDSAYFKFWCQLVKWAAKYERVIIARSKNVINLLLELGIAENKVVRFSSWQNVTWSKRNLRERDRVRICQILRSQTNLLKG